MADLKDLTLRFYKEVFSNGNIDAVDDLLVENAIEHEQPPPGLVVQPGRAGVKQVVQAYLTAFNPMEVHVHAQYQDGDTVVARVTYTGTHSGEFAGIPATNNTISVEGIDIFRCEGERLAEHWGQFDAVGLLTQLGVMPPM